uniref:Uncharacterized protein n=1 Tax=Mycena chlorophos TaxID=658473 RepID=A0ABQ0L0P5_MYCCL|nr:predicted protein [Mycena chlorophos]
MYKSRRIFLSSLLSAMPSAPEVPGSRASSPAPSAAAPFVFGRASSVTPRMISRRPLPRYPEWKESEDVTNHIRHTVKALSRKHMDETMCWSYQSESQLEILYAEAREQHAVLNKYPNNWPVKCLLIAHLKHTTSRAQG